MEFSDDAEIGQEIYFAVIQKTSAAIFEILIFHADPEDQNRKFGQFLDFSPLIYHPKIYL